MRKQISTFAAFAETMEHMRGNGILLAAGVPPNPMTIGWGTMGYIWNRPVFQVLVRPTRYTFGLIENVRDFTVNVLHDSYQKQISLCGTSSGRDIDKVDECHFTMVRAEEINAFYIAQSMVHYECRIIHKHTIDPVTLEPELLDRYYPLRDFHMVYYGEILSVYRET